MVHYQIKRVLRDSYLKNKLVIYKNSCKIHKSFLKKRLILSRGMYGRYILVYKENVGLTFGSFVSTRKFLNKPVYKKKR